MKECRTDVLHQNDLFPGYIGYVISGFTGRIAEAVLVAQSSTHYRRHDLRSDVIVERRRVLRRLWIWRSIVTCVDKVGNYFKK